MSRQVDAGADFIITQVFFESQSYINFVKECREIGIQVPIIPGIFPFTTVGELERMASISNVEIPPWLRDEIREAGNDDNAVRTLGIDLAVKLIQDIRHCKLSYGYHLFTLNRLLLFTFPIGGYAQNLFNFKYWYYTENSRK